jgi:hypothetical protein
MQLILADQISEYLFDPRFPCSYQPNLNSFLVAISRLTINGTIGLLSHYAVTILAVLYHTIIRVKRNAKNLCGPCVSGAAHFCMRYYTKKAPLLKRSYFFNPGSLVQPPSHIGSGALLSLQVPHINHGEFTKFSV